MTNDNVMSRRNTDTRRVGTRKSQERMKPGRVDVSHVYDDMSSRMSGGGVNG